tara:strand:+ start:576 stop:833 length:258 start_codon:yes stop_codon:yes gene_type:complete
MFSFTPLLLLRFIVCGLFPCPVSGDKYNFFNTLEGFRAKNIALSLLVFRALSGHFLAALGKPLKPSPTSEVCLCLFLLPLAKEEP